MNDVSTSEEISSAKILAGFCSFLFPGLGQLLLNRIWNAAICFIAFVVIWSIALKMVWDGLDNFSRLEVLMGGILGLTPHVVAAYFATHGDKFSKLEFPADWPGAKLQYNDEAQPQGFEFSDYASYQSWCQENGYEPMSLKQFDDTFGSKG